MSRDAPQFKLRMPASLKQEIEQSAAENRRSINAEIIARLDASLDELDGMGFSDRSRRLMTEEFSGAKRATHNPDEIQLSEPTEDHFAEKAIASLSEGIKGTLNQVEQLSLLVGWVALSNAYPGAMDEHQKNRLVKVIGQILGSDSADPSDLISSLSARLLVQVLERDIGI